MGGAAARGSQRLCGRRFGTERYFEIVWPSGPLSRLRGETLGIDPYLCSRRRAEQGAKDRGRI